MFARLPASIHQHVLEDMSGLGAQVSFGRVPRKLVSLFRR
jgi:hypothetical protein